MVVLVLYTSYTALVPDGSAATTRSVLSTPDTVHMLLRVLGGVADADADNSENGGGGARGGRIKEGREVGRRTGVEKGAGEWMERQLVRSKSGTEEGGAGMSGQLITGAVGPLAGVWRLVANRGGQAADNVSSSWQRGRKH